MHKSVLKKEVLKYLAPEPNQNFIDATLGEAGHTLSILEETKPEGMVLGIELCESLYRKLSDVNIERLILENNSFVSLKEIVRKNNFKSISGILFDLGFSTWHLKESKKGFSFKRDEPLDMRYNPLFSELTVKDVINNEREQGLANIIKQYGEERFSRRISRMIAKEREQNPIETTFQLVEVIRKAVPRWYRHKRIHFATRTFQALRIFINDELDNLKKALPQALEVLEKKGRIVVISFHSLEDRIVKNFFRDQSKKGLVRILTKKPIRASNIETFKNPSSSSAKLRAAVKL